MPASILELVQRIKVAVSDKSRWCAFSCALDANGDPVPRESEKAVRLDVLGHAYVVCRDEPPEVQEVVIREIAPRRKDGTPNYPALITANDVGHEVIMAVLDE